MTGLFERVLSGFMPQLLSGLVVNFEIAGVALGLGLALGVMLALARFGGGPLGAAAASAITLMRAAPTFVVMFFLLNALPRDSLSGVMTVGLSLVPYSAAFIADAGVDALRQLRNKAPLGALLFLPNVMRAFFVLVMSSGAAAAIGVKEAISAILLQADQLPSFGDRLVLFAIGVASFGVPLQLGFALLRVVQRRLGLLLMRRQTEAECVET